MNSGLARELKNAIVVPAATLKIGIEMLAEHKIDVYATNKANLFEMSDALPGSRVLDGRWGIEHLAMAIPNDRNAGLAYFARVRREREIGRPSRACGGPGSATRRRCGLRTTRGRQPAWRARQRGLVQPSPAI
jgi:hypothetical protein